MGRSDKDLELSFRRVAALALAVAFYLAVVIPFLSLCALIALAVAVCRYVLPIVGLVAVALAVVWIVKHG